jgi:hypothetical protein
MFDFLPGLIGAVIGGVLGLVAWVISQLLLPQRKCPSCGKRYAKFYWPRNWHQAWRGGRTCKKCGCETDRLGRVISEEVEGCQQRL